MNRQLQAQAARRRESILDGMSIALQAGCLVGTIAPAVVTANRGSTAKRCLHVEASSWQCYRLRWMTSSLSGEVAR